MGKYITNDNYKEMFDKNEFVVIYFYADWCGPCQRYGPAFESVSRIFKGVPFVKCNIDDDKRVAVTFGVRSIPTTVVVKDGKLILIQRGVMTENQLEEFVKKAIKKQ